ncbi:MAG: thiamine phosphate synthase [Muribaculaceae bacterium]|nr:thiamine phosphate synthase [Muribaculaceae bacterium]
MIVITPEEIRDDEAPLICKILQMGVSRVHLRHPATSIDDLRNIIREIPLEYRGRLTLHDHFELTADFPELGVNINRRNPELPLGRHGLVSRSCHSVEETSLTADYCLLSPIFPSFSKPGYSTEFTDEELMQLPAAKVYALGGIDCERIEAVKRYPFSGVAVLGSVWNKDTNAADVIRNVAKILERL